MSLHPGGSRMVGMLCSCAQAEWRASKTRGSEGRKPRRKEGTKRALRHALWCPACLSHALHKVCRQPLPHHTWGLICFRMCPSLSVTDSRITKLVCDNSLAVRDSLLCAVFDRFPCALLCPFSQARSEFSLLEYDPAVYVHHEIFHRIV